MTITKLEPIQEKHVYEIFQLIEENRAYLSQHLTADHLPQTEEDALYMIQNAVALYTRREGLLAGIRQSGQVVGMIGLHDMDATNRAARLVMWVGLDHQRQGLGFRAMRAMIKHGFMEVGLNRLEFRCAADNQPAHELAAKLKFTHEGQLRQALVLADLPADAALYSLLLSDWIGL